MTITITTITAHHHDLHHHLHHHYITITTSNALIATLVITIMWQSQQPRLTSWEILLGASSHDTT